MTNYRVTQKEMVIAAINHMPGCTLRDICEALELTTSNAGKLLRRLTKEGIIVKSHEDRDPGYGNLRIKGVVMSGGSVRSAYNRVFGNYFSNGWDMTRNRNITMPILILPNMY